MKIGIFFKEYRKKHKYTLQQMSEKIKYSTSQISLVERTNKASKRFIENFLKKVKLTQNEKKRLEKELIRIKKAPVKASNNFIIEKEFLKTEEKDTRFLEALDYDYVRRNEVIFAIKDIIEYNNLKMAKVDILTTWDEKDKNKLKKMIKKLIENYKEHIKKLESYTTEEAVIILEEE
ncbi:hypothetical protein BCB68_05215 [Leptotrichia sp. oral taxon 498]|uniref:helix-turn-helix domain-containing protein n=1 Tax=Leptotrichia sp. oral taxon 498 TaxID=712368 RepID=UPI000B8CB90B|nr:helix-turn-helix transcriptional regulator [Leptotrichia sp. oral taxon 498]ASQ48380.1 hypothetical protein BCB68_05215 [Leptotrichia sp. oral taxon 498]